MKILYNFSTCVWLYLNRTLEIALFSHRLIISGFCILILTENLLCFLFSDVCRSFEWEWETQVQVAGQQTRTGQDPVPVGESHTGKWNRMESEANELWLLRTSLITVLFQLLAARQIIREIFGARFREKGEFPANTFLFLSHFQVVFLC